MAKIIQLPTYEDNRGKLSVIEKILPFEIKRVYYIYDTNNKPRGGHRHRRTIQALICVSGSCEIKCQNKKIKENYLLNKPDKCLIIFPEDYHTIENFQKHTVLLVLSSEYFNAKDYIGEPYD